jgi:hypothetical protein
LRHYITAIINDDVIIPDTMSPALGSLLLGMERAAAKLQLTFVQFMALTNTATNASSIQVSALFNYSN